MIGEQIGNYNVVRKLGEGGMGIVYEAVHPIIGRRVALKILRQERCDDDDLVKRFFSEARVVNDIRHDHIVEVLDLGQTATGAYYLTMEYLEGESLAGRLAREKPLPLADAVLIASEAADALGAAHAKSVVHRDIKADNVFLIPKGDRVDYVKVLDFGIAKLTSDTGVHSHKTRTGAVIGTPATGVRSTRGAEKAGGVSKHLSSAARISPIDEKRLAGVLAMARSMTSSSPDGIPGRRADGGCGSRCICFISNRPMPSASKGTWPVTIS